MRVKRILEYNKTLMKNLSSAQKKHPKSTETRFREVFVFFRNDLNMILIKNAENVLKSKIKFLLFPHFIIKYLREKIAVKSFL